MKNLENLKSIAEKISNNTNSINSTNKEIYKSILFEGLTSEQKKKIRTSLRKQRNNLTFEISKCKESILKGSYPKTQINNFVKWYKENCVLQNLTIESISAKNMSEGGDKVNLIFALELIKSYCEDKSIVFANVDFKTFEATK